jgi:hypothetical protein
MTGVTPGMSIEAIIWALEDAPGVPAQCVSVLIGLANKADRHGRGAYPSAATLASWARKSKRQVHYDLIALSDAKLIREGDQSLVRHLPPNRRPVVYDLAVEAVRERSEVQSASSPAGVKPIADVQPVSPQQSTAPQTADDLQEHAGVQSTTSQVSDLLGCNAVPPGVQPTANKTSLNQEIDSGNPNNHAREDDSLFGEDLPPAGRKRTRPHQNPAARFEEWYRHYPLHKARGEGEKAYIAAVRAGADPDDLIAGAIRYQRDPKVLRGYIKNPATWLRAKCWLDEPEPEPSPQPEVARTAAATSADRRQQATNDQFDRAMKRAQEREANDPDRDRPASPVRQGVLPPAGH